MTPKPAAPIEIRLEVDLESQPIRGRLWPTSGPVSPFTGWLGLTAALQGLRDGDRDGTADAG